MIAEKVAALKKEIEELKAQTSEKFKMIDELYASCKHDWTPPSYRTRKLEDFQGGTYDSPTWERKCTLCEKLETTSREHLQKVPFFG